MDLRSLISICKVPESRRAEMTDGLSLFEHLIQRNIISEVKLDELKEILVSLRPKRRDLVRLVNDYQGLPTEEDDCSGIVRISRFPLGGEHQTPCCTVNWSCLKISCFKIHSCYVAICVLFVVAVLACSLFWFGNVPKISEHLDADRDRKNAGIYVIVALCVLFLLLLLAVFCGRKWYKKLPRGSHGSIVRKNHYLPADKANDAMDMAQQAHPVAAQDNLVVVNDQDLGRRTSSLVDVPEAVLEKKPFCPPESQY